MRRLTILKKALQEKMWSTTQNPEAIKESPKQHVNDSLKVKDDKPRMSSDVPKSWPSSALPADFFGYGDNKRQKIVSAQIQAVDTIVGARGIEPMKLDVNDEYKEFEKLIQEDLAQVDNRFEEEEIDADEQKEEEIIEQRNRVEELKRKKMELLAARSSKAGKVSEVPESKAEQDGLSSEDEDEDDESFAVDWGAQHL